MPKRRQPKDSPRWVQGCFDFYHKMPPQPVQKGRPPEPKTATKPKPS